MTNIKNLKIKQKKFYDSIVSIYCPILNNSVFFTSEGFNHLIYESNRMPRKIGEQFMKLKCLSDAPQVISKCQIITDTRKIQRKIKGIFKTVTRYELVHEVKKNIEIRVIVEKIGSGKFKFLSIMPHNKKSKKYHTIANKKKHR